MMRRYVFMYLAWVMGVAAMAALALTWYRKVEEIGMVELRERLRRRNGDTDFARNGATGATENTDPTTDDTGFYVSG